MAEIYRRFATGWEPCCDFSDQALVEMFEWESFGRGNLKFGLFNNNGGKYNGFAVGKHWMDVTIAMWREDLRTGMLFKKELQADFPEWFLKKIGII